MSEEESISKIIRGQTRKIATLNEHIFTLERALENATLDEDAGPQILEVLESLRESKEFLIGDIRVLAFLMVKEFLIEVSGDLMNEGNAEAEFDETVRALALLTAAADIIEISDWFDTLDPDKS